MHWLLQATGALLNILWIGLFLTPQPFSEFEQTESTDEEEMFCFPPPPVEIPSNKTNNTKTTFPAHPATAPGSEPTIVDSDNLGLTGSYPELEPTTRGSYPEVEPTTRGSYPEVEQTTRGSYPELEQTTRGSYPELEQTTRGSYPEVEPTPVSCCFEFFSGRVPLKDIKGYRKSPPMCPVEAIVIFTTTTLCVDPNAAWVKRLLITLDENGKGVNPDDSHSTPAPGSESATMPGLLLFFVVFFILSSVRSHKNPILQPACF
ncbi:uncharacterized protein LOC126404213 [Epinephelus moara]|uniref:uncharacterized protein LOC126404213 n=1 Tax=Epinephelus moara TaxID=300413 RepID=UPI00214E67E8|nr:uncharacterized protein LOC126404213 [Epinephelus moara]